MPLIYKNPENLLSSSIVFLGDKVRTSGYRKPEIYCQLDAKLSSKLQLTTNFNAYASALA